jgi:hypothetical protein
MLKPFEMNLSKEDIHQAGRVAVWSSMLDTAMEVSIWLLLDLPRPEARRMTYPMEADQKRQWLELLAKSHRLSTAQRDSLTSILSNIRSALENRNRVVHALWHIGEDGKPWAAKYNTKGNLTFHKRLDAPLIRPIAEENKQLAIKLAEWNDALEPGSMSASFPKKPFHQLMRPKHRIFVGTRRLPPSLNNRNTRFDHLGRDLDFLLALRRPVHKILLGISGLGPFYSQG